MEIMSANQRGIMALKQQEMMRKLKDQGKRKQELKVKQAETERKEIIPLITGKA